MSLIDGKQLRDTSLSLNKVSGINGLVNFTTATMSFSAGSTLRQADENIINGHDVVNKNYVDAVAQGLNIKESVHVISLTPITLSGTQSIDNHYVEVGERVLVNGQDNTNATSSNGIYVVASGSWSRSTDADGLPSISEVQVGDFVFVGHGDLYAGSGWVLNSSDSTDFNILVGTESQHWVQFSSAGVLQAGDGLIQVGNEFHINVGLSSSTGLTISSDILQLSTTGVIAGTYGSATEIPTFNVDNQGRLRSAGTVSLDLTSGSQTIAIGPPSPLPDNNYGDGLLTFTNSTPIGSAIDEINEILALLAPAPPKSWAGSITSLSISNTSYSSAPRILGSLVTTATPVFDSLTPTITNVDIVGTGSLARNNNPTSPTFSLVNNGLIIATATLSGLTTPNKITGNIQHSNSVDPYGGEAGKQGFWSGITSFQLANTISVTATSSARLLQLHYPDGGLISYTYYIDQPLTPTIATASISATVPSMAGNISGVPTLTTVQSVTGIGFSIANVSSYFWAPTNAWQIGRPSDFSSGHINTQTGDPDSAPSVYGETGTVTGKTGTVQTNQFSDLSFFFSVRGKNSKSVYGPSSSYISTSHRIDTVSNETERLTSGTGLYPSVGSAYDSVQSAILLSTNVELQLINGYYRWPQGNYTTVGGGNYNSITTGDNISGVEWRWATFALNNVVSPVTNITINFPSGTPTTNLGTSHTDIKMYVKIGASGWLDGTQLFDTPAPYNDGDKAFFGGASTLTSRIITFGTTARSGQVYVRIGIKSSNTSFVFRKPTQS